MPTYEVTDSQTGQKLRLTGDSPPTDAELEQIFSSLPESGAQPKSKPDQAPREFPLPPPVGVPYTDPLPEGAAPRNEVVTTGPPSLMQRAGRYVGDYARGVRDSIQGLDPMTAGIGGVEAAATLATGALSPISSLMSNFVSNRGEVPPEEFVYQPRTQSGKALVNTIGAVAKPLSDSGADVALAPLAAETQALNIPRVAKATRAPSAADAVIAEGEKHAVPVFFDDVTKSAVAKKVGVAAEPLGAFGTGSGRAKQSTAAQQAAQRVVQSKAPSIGDDVPVLVQQGLGAKLKEFRATSRDLYKNANDALDPLGEVPRPGFDSVIQAAKQEVERRGTLANPAVAALLEKYDKAPRSNFSLTREMRSQLSDDISDFYTGANSAIGEKGVTTLQNMKTALDADLGAFAKSSGGKGYDAWKMADAHYKANIVPFKEAGFRDLVKTAEPEKAWRYLLAQGSLKSRAARMYNSLDDNGKSAVRYGLVKDALDGATNPNGTFSPAKFAKYLEDHENAVNTFFKGSDLQEIKGFQNLMRHVERAGQFAENPPTGQRLIPFLLGGAAMVEPTTAGTIAAAGVTVRALFQSKTGRNLLLGMSRAKEGSPAMATLARRAARVMAKTGPSAAAVSLATSQAAEKERSKPQ